MTVPLSCLFVEDSADDAKLIEHQLRNGGYDVTSVRVDTAGAMRDALDCRSWDVVISDYRIPGFGGMEALTLLRARDKDVPFILVSGAVGETAAVAAMKAGAQDYLMKDNLTRLVPAVQRELRDAMERRARQRAVTALVESEERWKFALEGSGDGLWDWDLSAGNLLYSTRWKAMLGYAEDEIGNRIEEWSSRIHPDDLAATMAATQTHIEGKTRQYRTEHRVRCKDGSWKWILDRGLVVRRDDAGKPLRMIGTHTDISEQKEAARKIRRLTDFYVALAHCNEAIARSANANEMFRNVCGAAVTYGHIAMAWVGLIGNQRVTPAASYGDDLGYLKDIEISTRVDDPLGRGPTGTAARDGVPVWIDDFQSNPNTAPWHERAAKSLWQSSAALPLIRQGEVVGTFTLYLRESEVFDPEIKQLLTNMAANISLALDRFAAHAALHLQGAALQAAANPIVITDIDGTITWANAAFGTMSGYDVAEVVGKNPRSIAKSAAQPDAFYRNMWKTILAGDVWEGELVNRRKDGTTYPEQMTITPVRNSEGKISNFIAVKEDLTAERKRQSEFLQAQKMESVGRLAGGVAHDFNNLLTVILSYAKFIEEDLPADDPRHEDIRQILSAGESAAQLTARLLAFSRQQVLEPKPMSVNDVATATEAMLRRLIGEDISLTLILAPDLSRIMADRGQIEQIIMNLSVNARDAMAGNGGALTIETSNVATGLAPFRDANGEKPGACVQLRVTDTGRGMDEPTLQRIFEPFFTTKEWGKGTGLGLSTVHGIVTERHGHIDVESRLGAGTTFSIYFPALDAVQAKAEPAAQEPASDRGTETVLVVEDAEPIRTAVCNVLKRRGYLVLEAPDAMVGLKAAAAHEGPIHLLLTDVVMPGMDGRELSDTLRLLRPGLKVLFMSGYTSDTIAEHGMLDEGIALLHKPFTPEPLARKVREVLDGS